MTSRYTRFFNDIGIDDVPLVGGKNASLGEMYRALGSAGVPVPNGFAIAAAAYWLVLERANALPALREAIRGLDPANVADLVARARRMREIVYGAPLPADLVREIIAAYGELKTQYGEDMSVAVRSSATAEDLPHVSFAGMHESFLNVRGEDQLLDACRRCFASVFTDRAIH